MRGSPKGFEGNTERPRPAPSHIPPHTEVSCGQFQRGAWRWEGSGGNPPLCWSGQPGALQPLLWRVSLIMGHPGVREASPDPVQAQLRGHPRTVVSLRLAKCVLTAPGSEHRPDLPRKSWGLGLAYLGAASPRGAGNGPQLERDSHPWEQGQGKGGHKGAWGLGQQPDPSSGAVGGLISSAEAGSPFQPDTWEQRN